MSAAELQRAFSVAEERAPAQLDWLKGLREQALQRFTKQGGFPSQRDEDWKYTDLSPVATRALAYLDETRLNGQQRHSQEAS